MIEMLHCFKLENAKVVFLCEINAKVVEGLKLRFIIMDKQFPQFITYLYILNLEILYSGMYCVLSMLLDYQL